MLFKRLFQLLTEGDIARHEIFMFLVTFFDLPMQLLSFYVSFLEISGDGFAALLDHLRGPITERLRVPVYIIAKHDRRFICGLWIEAGIEIGLTANLIPILDYRRMIVFSTTESDV